MSALTDKYKSVIALANSSGISNLKVDEKGTVLKMSGNAPSEAVKDKLWDAYAKIDPDMRAGDLVLDINVAAPSNVYVVKAGDTLGKIAKQYPGMTWQKIFEANKDVIKNPDMIFPGQKFKIPA
jgi:nucleoid-associated protein YgaU